MPIQTDTLGGRLPLLDRHAMSLAQCEIYERLERTMIRWAEDAHFRTTTDDGRLYRASVRLARVLDQAVREER
jgi:hypothetical protein